ncbi:PAS domain S-box protein [Phreatobacter stygius]|uniref:sensor histidine kinase n=1 Tax=Phreatobacter stygius TaxID=1940610 RepID=UPI0014774A57|nr:PAS domain S-box protein [Phreatobacter stygius]
MRLSIMIGGLVLAASALAAGLVFQSLGLPATLEQPVALAPFPLLEAKVLIATWLGGGAIMGRVETSDDAEQAMADWGLRYGLYWENSAESLFAVRVEADGRFIYEGMNPAQERRSGIRSSAIAGREPHQCLEPALADQVVARFRQCVEAGRPIRYQQVYDFAGAPPLVLQMVLVPLWNADHSRVIALLGSGHDVTELQASESRFRLVADTIPDMLYLLETSDDSFFINRSFQDFTGMPAGLSCDELRHAVVHPDDIGFLEASQAETTGEFAHELRIRRADGEYLWFSNKGQIVRDERGEIERLFGVAINIHDLKAAEEAARATQGRLEAILFAVGDCFIGLDPELRITEVSGPATEWFGVSEAHLRGQKYFDILGRRDAFARTIERAVQLQRPTRIARRSAFVADRWIELNVYPTAKGVGILFHDITDRKQAEQQKQDQTTFLQSTIDALAAAIAIIDHDGKIIAVNRAWRVMGEGRGSTQKGSGVGHAYLSTWIRGAVGLDLAGALQRHVGDILAGRSERFETLLKLADHPLWLLVKATRFAVGNAEHIVVTHEDVTEIFRRDAELRTLSAQLLETQDAERRRIARELHDSTAQHLIGIQLGLAGLRDKLPADAQTRNIMEDIRTALKDAQQEVRVLSYLLHPPALEHGDLMSALDRFVTGYSARTGLAVDFRTNSRATRLAEDTAIAMMRIAQEALTNVLKHAGASKAVVRLRDQGNWLVLDIFDDGIGIPFDPQGEAHAGLGVGLPGMKARVVQLGGKLTIRRRAGKGTMVRASIPVGH